MMYLFFIFVFAVTSRLVPHMWNVGVISALAIFAGTYLPKKYAFGIPLLARFVSDIFLGFFSWKLMLAVYLSHALAVLLGVWIGKDGLNKWVKITASGFGSAAMFFLITNFAFLYENYPHNLSGVILSYFNGLPFLRGTLIGDVGYTLLFFVAYEFYVKFISTGNFKFNKSWLRQP